MPKLEALWSIKFHSETFQSPGVGGVVVLDTGRILGGDPWFTFVGDYKVVPDRVWARLHVRRYKPLPAGIVSIADLDNYVGIFEGPSDDKAVNLEGCVEGRREIKICVEMIRRAELL